MLGYVGKKGDGSYAPFHWNSSLLLQDVEISDDVFLIQREVAEAYAAGKVALPPVTAGGTAVTGGTMPLPLGGTAVTQPGSTPTTGTQAATIARQP